MAGLGTSLAFCAALAGPGDMQEEPKMCPVEAAESSLVFGKEAIEHCKANTKTELEELMVKTCAVGGTPDEAAKGVYEKLLFAIDDGNAISTGNGFGIKDSATSSPKFDTTITVPNPIVITRKSSQKPFELTAPDTSELENLVEVNRALRALNDGLGETDKMLSGEL